MPIRINLLAEAQAAEEMRRKDPVKRAIMGAATVVALFLVWVGYRQVTISRMNSRLKDLNAQWNKIKPGFDAVKEKKDRIKEAKNKLADLNRFAATHLRWTDCLNALQQCMTNVSTNVQVIRFYTEQRYLPIPPVLVPHPRIPEEKVVKGGTGIVTEKSKIFIEARDYGRDVDENHIKFREAISSFPYFRENLAEKGRAVRLDNLAGPGEGRPFTQFTLVCEFTDKVRP